MNAYELADINDWSCCAHVKEVSAMLRQQADEIQALKDGFNTAWGGTNNSELAEVRAMANRMILKVKEQADRIAELEKAFINQRVQAYAKSLTDGTKASAIAKVLNAEPAAWMLTLPDGTHDWILDGKGCEGYIPLYTTPQIKELSDEEIEEFAYAFELWQLNNPDKALEGIKDFARAILRKAQEK